MAFMSSSLRVAHCAIAQDNMLTLCGEKVSSLVKLSWAMAVTNWSFHKPHFAKANAVSERWRCSNCSILLTTSAATTDMSDSMRTPWAAKPQTMWDMSCGSFTRYFAMSAIRFISTAPTGSMESSFPIDQAMSASSFGVTLTSGGCIKALARWTSAPHSASFLTRRASCLNAPWPASPLAL